jgi:hypothetical protein
MNLSVHFSLFFRIMRDLRTVERPRSMETEDQKPSTILSAPAFTRSVQVVVFTRTRDNASQGKTYGHSMPNRYPSPDWNPAKLLNLAEIVTNDGRTSVRIANSVLATPALHRKAGKGTWTL